MILKQKIKIITDILMLVVLLLLMGYSLIGEAFHEWAGCAMFALFLLHHGLNWNWHKNLAHGRYSRVRVLMTATNAGIFALMMAQMVSGVMLSMHIFTTWNAGTSIGTGRLIHLAVPYWLFALTAIHLGLHWGNLLKVFRHRNSSLFPGWLIWGLAVCLAGYGGYAFQKRQFAGYMFLRNRYAFFDFSEPLIFFFLDYLAILCLFVLIGYVLHQLILGRMKRNGGQ